MSGIDPTAAVAPLKPWERALYAAVACLGGTAMVVAAVAQLAALARALHTLPPAIEAMMGTPGLLLMGIAITGFGLLALQPPAIPSVRLRGRNRPRLDRGQRVVAVALICLVLVPVATVALRLGMGSYLEDCGYRREIVDPGFHSRFLTIRWTRNAMTS